MKAKFINESVFVSKFRPKMNVKTKNNQYYITKVEDHSHKFDIIHVIDKYGKKKMISSDWLEQNGTIIPNKRKSSPSEYPSMTTREYIKEIKGAIDGIKQTADDLEDPGSYIYDSAESMIYDESLYNYLYKKYKRQYDQTPHYRRDLIELLANDMSNAYWK
jgi:hypothetical protein